MGLMDMFGLDTSNPEKAKKSFLKMIGTIKPMMEGRGIKSIIIHFKDGELDLQMLEHCCVKREQELIKEISRINNRLLNK